MIGISKLYCGTIEASDPLRYGRASGKLPAHLLQFAADKKPIVVFNCTKRCNLRCKHCYSASTDAAAPDELSTEIVRRMIDDLAAFGAPVLLFSGGEPMVREDIYELISHAAAAGLRVVLSTNGTLITPEVAERLAEIGLHYAGISLDGMQQINDEFRCVSGAFDATLAGIRNCKAAGLKVGLRLTMNANNVSEIPAVFDLIEREGIPRVCFYHLVHTGRGRAITEMALSHTQTRDALDSVMDRTKALHDAGKPIEVLTVDNHADGPYVYMRLARENPARAEQCLKLLEMNGGNSSGLGIACVSWNGDVLADQFLRNHVLGNVTQRPFSEIWSAPQSGGGLLGQLRRRKKYRKCRCMNCKWLSVCNGNFRARAEAATGDIWGDDPACYLTDQEIQ